MSRRKATGALAVALTAAYATLAVLVSAGTLNGLDQWSIDHTNGDALQWLTRAGCFTYRSASRGAA